MITGAVVLLGTLTLIGAFMSGWYFGADSCARVCARTVADLKTSLRHTRLERDDLRAELSDLRNHLRRMK